MFDVGMQGDDNNPVLFVKREKSNHVNQKLSQRFIEAFLAVQPPAKAAP
jgi:hypothetical protein|tara:strand:+ start:186 stop:332 length:147 start_codon:yes stop_codon:yes gene_type:complete